MKIGIDISQIAFEKTGVSNYIVNLVQNLVKTDNSNEYVLFFSSMRRKFPVSSFLFPKNSKVKVKTFKYPPMLLDLIWNKFHIFPIEKFIGNIDVFISSDWTEPPTKKAKKITFLYDLIVYKCPYETDNKIIKTQKRKLYWTKKECDSIICISESTKKDAIEILGINEEKLKVVYPGI